MSTVDRVRNIEALRLPSWPWLPPALSERIVSHNMHLDKLAQQWSKHDEAAADSISKTLSSLPTQAQLLEIKAKLHNSAVSCFKAELAIMAEDYLAPLLEAIQKGCQVALDESIEDSTKTEQAQIVQFLKANGFSNPEQAGPRLSIIEGQARNSQPCRDAAAMIEETRQAGWAISTQGNQIREYRTKRLQAVRKLIASELQAVASFAAVPVGIE